MGKRLANRGLETGTSDRTRPTRSHMIDNDRAHRGGSSRMPISPACSMTSDDSQRSDIEQESRVVPKMRNVDSIAMYVLPKRSYLSSVAKLNVRELVTRILSSFIQESRVVDEIVYVRRFHIPRQDPQSISYSDQNASQVKHEDDKAFQFTKVMPTSFLQRSMRFMIAKERSRPDNTLAVRILPKEIGFWIDEIQVYLLPNFAHKNILPLYGADMTTEDIRYPSVEALVKERSRRDAGGCGGKQGRSELDSDSIRVENWLMNKYLDCITLREHLEMHTLTWLQMISIARGIMEGLHYLHEKVTNPHSDNEKLIDSFIKSTNGAIKKVSFIDGDYSIRMGPEPLLSIIHGNLSSLSIVLRGDRLTPCIWNFSKSHIYYTLQAYDDSGRMKIGNRNLANQYWAPELFSGGSEITPEAMWSIDMYAAGMILWELMSRCTLPEINIGTESPPIVRNKPDKYLEPFEDELGARPSINTLEYAVCRLEVRPQIKDSWLAGMKTYRFVQIFKDLWQQDHNVRPRTKTTIDRLGGLSLSNVDLKRKLGSTSGKKVFGPKTMYPIQVDCTLAPPYPGKCSPNCVFEDLSIKKDTSDSEDYDFFSTSPNIRRGLSSSCA